MRPLTGMIQFTGPRAQVLKRQRDSRAPAEATYGLSEMHDVGIALLFRDPVQERGRLTWWLSRPVDHAFVRWLGAGCRVGQAIVDLGASRGLDVLVATTDSIALGDALVRKLLRSSERRPPLIWISIGLAQRLGEDRVGAAMRRVVRSLLGEADLVITFCESEADRLRCFAPSTMVRAVRFGVDTEFWRPVPGPAGGPLRPAGGPLRVVSFGANPDRDFETAVIGIKRAGAEAHLVVAQGRSVPSEADRVERALPHEELRSRIAAAHAVVIASRDVAYGAGQVSVLSAMAMGKPVVATRSPWMEEYGLRSGDGLVVVPPGDAHAIASSLRRLATGSESMAALGERARQAVVRAACTSKDMARELGGFIGDCVRGTERGTSR